MRDEKESMVQVKTLKEQVYQYLRDRIQEGELQPGSWINMEQISKKLGISVTPLRDALLRLETEGFVSVFPRRGIRVNRLTGEDIRNAYQIIGSLEAAALLECVRNQPDLDITPLIEATEQMKKEIDGNNFDRFYQHNLQFHNFHLYGAGNPELIRIVENKRRRLYDFQRKKGIYREWETASIEEHRKIIGFLQKGEVRPAADYIRDVHWSYAVQEKYIEKYYEFAP